MREDGTPLPDAPDPADPAPGQRPADARLRELLERLEAGNRSARRAPRRPRPSRRVALALLAAALGVGSVAIVTASAGLRHWLTGPFSEQPAGRVELAAASSSLRPRESGGRPNVRVEVSVAPRALDLRAQPVTLEVRRGGTVTVRRRTVSVASGDVALVLLSAPLPRGRGPWAAAVTLPGRSERLLLSGGTPPAERG